MRARQRFVDPICPWQAIEILKERKEQRSSLQSACFCYFCRAANPFDAETCERGKICAQSCARVAFLPRARRRCN